MTCTNTFEPTTYDKPHTIELKVEDYDAEKAEDNPADPDNSLYMFAQEEKNVTVIFDSNAPGTFTLEFPCLDQSKQTSKYDVGANWNADKNYFWFEVKVEAKYTGSESYEVDNEHSLWIGIEVTDTDENQCTTNPIDCST